jgi:polar amino acid transport system ATP-binding protein
VSALAGELARRDRHVRVLVHAGVVVESGNPGEVLDNPQHERTRAFLSKVL